MKNIIFKILPKLNFIFYHLFQKIFIQYGDYKIFKIYII